VKQLKLIGLVVTLISVMFIGTTVWRIGLNVARDHITPRLIVLSFIAALLSAFAIGISAKCWASYFEFFAKVRVPFPDAFVVYARSNVLKYLPGNVVQYIGRNVLAQRFGDQVSLGLSSVWEIGGSFLGGAAVLFLFARGELFTLLNAGFSRVQAPGPVTLAALILLLVLIVFAFVLRPFRRLRNPTRSVATHVKHMASPEFLFLLVFNSAIYGALLCFEGFVLVVLIQEIKHFSLTDRGQVEVVAFSILSWLAGFVVPGSPGGLGVREVILYGLLSPICGAPTAVLAAAIWRLITMTGDVLAVPVAQGILWVKNRRSACNE
jgi:uncharacterized membrane protein YbhN (UPF0104 family)